MLSVLTAVSNLEEACFLTTRLVCCFFISTGVVNTEDFHYLSHFFPLGEWVYFFLLVTLTGNLWSSTSI